MQRGSGYTERFEALRAEIAPLLAFVDGMRPFAKGVCKRSCRLLQVAGFCEEIGQEFKRGSGHTGAARK